MITAKLTANAIAAWFAPTPGAPELPAVVERGVGVGAKLGLTLELVPGTIPTVSVVSSGGTLLCGLNDDVRIGDDEGISTTLDDGVDATVNMSDDVALSRSDVVAFNMRDVVAFNMRDAVAFNMSDVVAFNMGDDVEFSMGDDVEFSMGDDVALIMMLTVVELNRMLDVIAMATLLVDTGLGEGVAIRLDTEDVIIVD